MKVKEQVSKVNWFLAVALLGFATPFAASAQTTTKIMLLGDSITKGAFGVDTASGDTVGFRQQLDQMLTAELGATFDFVGTLRTPASGGGFDADHEGHGGFRADEILDNVNTYLTNNPPDVVLLHIGTNDITELGQTPPGHATNTVQSTVDEIDQILTGIWNFDPTIKVVLSSVIPRSDDTALDDSTTALNAKIQALYLQRRNAGKNIFFAGHNEAFKCDPNWAVNLMASDPRHPNNTGYALMAEVYFNVLMNALTNTDITVTDNFERTVLGGLWDADPGFTVQNGDLVNTSGDTTFDFIALYKGITNPNVAKMRWSTNADAAGVRRSGLVLMMETCSPDGNGYAVTMRTAFNEVRLWTISNGMLDDHPVDKVGYTLPDPSPGQELKVVVSSDASGHHFDVSIDGQFYARVSDANKLRNGKYAGVIVKASLNNPIEDFSLETGSDIVKPAPVVLTVTGTTPTTVTLQWNAPGDDGNVGTAATYDLRYSTSTITDANFAQAMQASGEPNPDTAGTVQSATVAGLTPGTTYFFAMVTRDDAGNTSDLSNVPSATTASGNVFVENFDNGSLANWSTDPVYGVQNGELANTSTDPNVWPLAVLTARRNPSEISFTWGTGADASGIDKGGIALMLDQPGPMASGYLITRRTLTNELRLWEVVNGVIVDPPIQIATPTLAPPQAGDEFKIIPSSDANGNYFDVFVRGQFDSRLQDTQKLHGNGPDNYSGVMLRGDLNNNIDNFTLLLQAGPPTSLEVFSGNNQTGVVGQFLTQPLKVQLVDNSGIGVEGATINFRILQGADATVDVPPARNDLVIEAESGALSGQMVSADDPQASNGKFIWLPDGVGNQTGDAQYTFFIEQAGNYKIWGRAIAPDALADVFFIQVDSGPEAMWDVGQRAGFVNWDWDEVADRGTGTATNPETDPVIYNLSAGQHTLLVKGGKDGTKLDQIIITQDFAFVPSGIEQPGGVPTDASGIAQANLKLATAAGQNVVEASFGGLTPVTFTATGVAGPPATATKISGDGQQATPGTQLPQPFVAEFKDQFGNPIDSLSVDFNVVTGNGSMVMPNPLFTDSLGRVQNTLVTATDGPVSEVQVVPTGLTDPSVTFTATALPGAPKFISDAGGNNQTGTAGKPLAAPFQALVTDTIGTPIAGHNVTFTVTGGGGNFGGQTQTTVTTNAQGIASATLTLGPTPGTTNTVQASSGSLIGSPVTFTASSAVPQSIASLSPLNFTGTANVPLNDSIKVEVRDAINGTIPNYPVTFTITMGGGKVNGNPTSVEVPTDANGIAKVQWRLGTQSGQNNNKMQATSSFSGQALSGSPITYTASANPGQAANLVKVSGDQQVGEVLTTLTDPFVVRVTDGAGNVVAGWPVTFTVTAGGGNFNGQTSVEVLTDAQGEAKATLTLGSEAGTPQNPFNNKVTVTSENNGPLNGSPMTFEASAKATSASQLVLLQGNNQTGQAGLPLPLMVKVKVTDDQGNGIPDHPVQFMIDSGGGTIDGTAATDTAKQITTDANGEAGITWYLGGDLSPNGQKLRITSTDGINDLNGSPTVVQATATTGPVDPDSSSITTNVSELPADGQSVATITVTLTDKFKNPVAGKAVIIQATGSNNFITQPMNLTDANGQAVGTISSTRAEVKNVSARNLTDGFDLNVFVPITFTSLSASTIEASGGNNQTANVGTAVENPIEVLVTDDNNNPVPGVTVDFEVTSGGGTIQADDGSVPGGALGKSSVAVVTDSNGKARAQWILGPSPGVNTAEARVQGLTGSPVGFTATGVNAVATTMAVFSGQNQTAGIVGTTMPEPLGVKVTDASGKAVAGVQVNFIVQAGGGRVETANPVTDYRGVAQTMFVLGSKVGTNIVEASNSSLTGSPVTFVFESVVGTPAILRVHGDDELTGTVNTEVPVSLEVTDIHENPVQGIHAAFQVTQGGATITSQQNSTSDTGVATAMVLLPQTVGTVVVRGTSNDLPGFFVEFTITVVSGNASAIAEVSGNNQQGTVGRELVEPLIVVVRDQFGNPVSGHEVQWVRTQGSGSLRLTSTVSDDQGLALNYFTLGSQPGANEAWAIASTLSGSPVVFSATGVTNNFPVFANLSDRTVVEGILLTFQVEATDDDGDPLTYSAENLPPGAIFEPGSRTFSWTPGEQQAGEYHVTFIVEDNKGGRDVESIKITVKNSNTPPAIVSFSPSSLTLLRSKGTIINFSVTAQDADNDPLSFKWFLVDINNNATQVSSSSTFEFITQNFSPATYIIRVEVSDGSDVTSLEWTIDVVVSVELASFTGHFSGFKGVQINWVTSREIDNLGFNILRSQSRNGTYEKVNDALIPASANGRYQFADKGVKVGSRYFYKLEDIDVNGRKTEHGPIVVDVTPPETFELSQNFPNPFNPETHIRFQIPEAGLVTIKIFDVLGREVRTLINEQRQAGFHEIVWDAKNNDGIRVSSGIYYYRISAGDFQKTKKMLLLK